MKGGKQKKAIKRKSKVSAKSLDYSSWPTMPNEQVLSDWFEHRKLKRASVTQTVINSIGSQLHECMKAEISVDMALEAQILRGWTGLQAEWIISHYSSGTSRVNKSQITSNSNNGVFDMNDTDWAEGMEQRLRNKKSGTYGD